MSLPFWDAWHEASITSLGLFWTAFWAFGLGYAISSMIQVFVTRARIQQLMGRDGWWSMMLATFFGFVSSSCSFAALAGARSLFTKGAGFAPSLAFLLASTNLVIELGILIAVFLSWPFVVGEYVGGIVLIAVMWAVVHLTQSWAIDVEEARNRARKREQEGGGGGGGHCHHHHGGGGGGEKEEHHHHQHQDPAKDEEQGDEDTEADPHGKNSHNSQDNSDASHDNDDETNDDNDISWWKPLTSLEKWQQVAITYCMEWGMVWKDVTVGFTVAGIIAAFVPQVFFEWMFVGSGDSAANDDLSFGEILEQIVVGPVAAFFTFIGSMGNIPLAAVLYGNNVSFAGIMAFIFSDLVVLPIIRINAKFYGWHMALYILAVFWICLIVTSLVLHYVFDTLGILPSADSKSVSERDFFEFNYTFALNIVFLLVTAVSVAYKFYKNGFPQLFGGSSSSLTERILFWLALVSYFWLIGGLFAGLAK